MAGPRCTVGVLILLDMNEVPVEVRNEYGHRRAVGVTLIGCALDGIGCVDAGIYNRQIRLLARAGQFVGSGFSQQQITIDLLFCYQHPRRVTLHYRGQPVLV